MPERQLIEKMANAFVHASMDDLIDLYAAAHQLPSHLEDGDQEYMRSAYQREAWTITYMDFCLRRYGHGSLAGARALDAGCGSGGALAHLAERFDEVVGIDPDLPALLIAAKRLDDHGVSDRVTLVAAMLEQPIIRAGACDAVKCTDVIEHVANPAQAAKVMGLVMSENSAAFVLTPNRWSLFSPEPHVRLWGVNLLPRRLADAYVEGRIGLRYSHIARLLSVQQLLSVLESVSADVVRLVPIEDKHLNPNTSRGARLKQVLCRRPFRWLSVAARPFQPTLEAVCIKQEVVPVAVEFRGGGRVIS